MKKPKNFYAVTMNITRQISKKGEGGKVSSISLSTNNLHKCRLPKSYMLPQTTKLTPPTTPSNAHT